MSQTGRTVPGMNEPLGRYTVTVTVGCDGGYLPDPAAFAAAAHQAAWSRSASIISAHLTDKVISVVTVTVPDRHAAAAVVSDALKRQAPPSQAVERSWSSLPTGPPGAVGNRRYFSARPSANQELCHPESVYLEKAPSAQLTRIGAADRLFSAHLTRITSVPECAVSSVGFLWDQPPCRGVVGVLWGSSKPLTGQADPTTGTRVPPTSGS